MEWEEYLKESKRTVSEEFHCGRRVEGLLHGVIGILTETEEILENYKDGKFDGVNVLEEVGDIFWYSSMLVREFNINVDNIEIGGVDIEDPREIIISIIVDSLKLLDILKKKLYYNKIIDGDVLSSFILLSESVITKLMKYVSINNIDYRKIFIVNIDKLRERYPDKFDSNLAINRNLINERKILEQ